MGSIHDQYPPLYKQKKKKKETKKLSPCVSVAKSLVFLVERESSDLWHLFAGVATATVSANLDTGVALFEA